MREGELWYVVVHAYYHFLIEVAEANPSSVKCKRCVQVHSCGRGWTSFFADGCKSDTRMDHWPEGTILEAPFIKSPWPHEIPRRK